MEGCLGRAVSDSDRPQQVATEIVTKKEAPLANVPEIQKRLTQLWDPLATFWLRPVWIPKWQMSIIWCQILRKLMMITFPTFCMTSKFTNQVALHIGSERHYLSG